MSITYGFYDSLSGDRKYYASQISQLFNALIKDGVFMNIGNHLNVKQGSGMQILVEPGFAWFNSTWTRNDADYPLTIESSDLLQPRIDAIVLEINETVAIRENAIKVIKGTPASNPQKPSLTNTSDVHQYPLAYVTISVGATSITNGNIENRIGLSECPYVTGVLETMNVDTLIQQWQGEFDDWFTKLQSDGAQFTEDAENRFNEWFTQLETTLSGDVAGNLLNMINGQDYLYSAVFELDNWVDTSSEEKREGFLFKQTATVKSETGGLSISSLFKMTSGMMIEDVYPVSTLETLKDSATIIDDGRKIFSENSITVLVAERPTSDVEVFFTAMKGVG